MRCRVVIPTLAAVLVSCVSPSGRGVVASPSDQMDWLEAFPSDDSTLFLKHLGIAAVDELAFPYNPGEGAIEHDSGVARIRGVVVALNLKEESARTWLSAASPSQRQQLRYVLVPDDLAPPALAALREVAALKPDVSLGFKSDSVADRLLPLFRPRILSLESELTAEQAAEQPQLEILMTVAETAGSIELLGLLPNLRHVYLGDWNTRIAGVFPRNLRLESLTARAEGDSAERIVNLDWFPRIRRIFLSNFHVEAGSLTNNRVQALDLSLSRLTGRRDLSHLKGLRRFGLPGNMTRNDLTNFIAAHPRLEAVALVEVDSLNDLTPLLRLTRLREVVLTEAFDGIESLAAIRSLRYLGLPDDMWEKDSSRIVALRGAMPQVTIAKITTFCLGSGWILLVVAAGAAGLVARRRRVAA